MNDPKRLNLLAAAGPSRFAGNKDYRAMMEPVERGVLEQVRLRQQDPGYTDGTDIAAMLGEARYEDGSPMSEQDLRDELVTLLTDGPTSSLISWAFERILRHPEQYARLRAEVDAGRGGHLSRRGGEGDDAPVPGRADRGAQAARANGARRLHDSRRTTVAPCVHLVHRRPDIYPEPLRSGPSASSSARPAPTPGSPSAAACGAAWRPATRSC